MADSRLAVIDDERGFCEFVAKVAESCGYEVFATDSADAFFDYVRTQAPSGVIVDLKMPKVDGVEVLRGLAAEGFRAKVLLASGIADKVLASAMRLGRERGLDMVGVIAKPIRARELEKVLEDLKPTESVITDATLAAAIDRDEIVLHYQPRLDLRSRRFVGAEALARWQHPHRGLIPPAQFIPLAERSDLIDRLTDRVFAKALAQAGEWRRAELDLGVSVNLSARNIRSVDLPDRTLALCQGNGVEPDAVTIELTETATMQNHVELMDVLTRFRLKGFHLSIDDFGAGYSSLMQLQRLPFSEMKIDKSFVMSMLASRDSAVIVKTIIDMAHNLGLHAVAEGVEMTEVESQLTAMGCDFAQGYSICRPQPAEQVTKMIRSDIGRD